MSAKINFSQMVGPLVASAAREVTKGSDKLLSIEPLLYYMVLIGFKVKKEAWQGCEKCTYDCSEMPLELSGRVVGFLKELGYEVEVDEEYDILTISWEIAE